MPKPKDGESRSDFIQRCMSDAEAKSDFPDNDQRVAFCHSQWRRNSKDETTLQRVGNAAIITRMVREETLYGRNFLVAPVVMVVEMVLNGELLPWEQIQTTAAEGLWEGRPVTLNHPTKDDQFISAGLVDAADQIIGAIHNVTSDLKGKKLKGEAWIDIELAERTETGKALLSRLRAHEPLEVSTAYLASAIPESGVFNGKPYFGIQDNIRPDHLAILTDEEGACSLKDGCGTPRLNKAGQARGDDVGTGDATSVVEVPSPARHDNDSEEPMEENKGSFFVKVMNAVGSAFGFDNDTYLTGNTDTVEYPIWINTTLGTPDSNVPDEIVSVGESTDDDEQGKDGDMERAALIDLLVNSECCEVSREELEETPDKILHLLANRLKEEDEPAEPAVEPEPESTDEVEPEPEVTANEADEAADNPAIDPDVVSVLNDLGSENIRNLLDMMKANVDQALRDREQVVARLVANERCQLTEEQLNEFDFGALVALEKSLAPSNFSGQGGLRTYGTEKPKDEWHSDGLLIVPGPAPTK